MFPIQVNLALAGGLVVQQQLVEVGPGLTARMRTLMQLTPGYDMDFIVDGTLVSGPFCLDDIRFDGTIVFYPEHTFQALACKRGCFGCS